MANLSREEIIKRGYVTDTFIVNSNIDVDSDLFKASITDRFYYDLIYNENNKETVKEEVIETPAEETVKEVIETPVEETIEEVIETPVEPENKSKKSTKTVVEVDPVEPESK